MAMVQVGGVWLGVLLCHKKFTPIMITFATRRMNLIGSTMNNNDQILAMHNIVVTNIFILFEFYY